MADTVLKDVAASNPIKILKLADIAFRRRDKRLMELLNFTNVRLDLTQEWADNDDWNPIPYMTTAALMPRITGRWTFSKYPLHDAVSKNPPHVGQSTLQLLKLFVIDMLREDRTRVNDVDDLNETPLHRAASKGNLVMMRLLLDNEADVGRTDDLGMTPLMMAARMGRLNAIRVLLQRGAAPTINDQDTFSFTALIHASELGQTDAVQELIKEGANVTMNEDHPHPRTALHRAAINGYPSVVRILLDYGADANGGSQEGVKTPLELARENGHDDVVRVLEEELAGRRTAGMFRSRMVV